MSGLRIVHLDKSDDLEPAIESRDMRPTPHRGESRRAFKARIAEAERVNEPQHVTKTEIGDEQIERIIAGVSAVVVAAVMEAMKRDVKSLARKAVAKAWSDGATAMRRRK